MLLVTIGLVITMWHQLKIIPGTKRVDEVFCLNAEKLHHNSFEIIMQIATITFESKPARNSYPHQRNLRKYRNLSSLYLSL